MFPKKDDPLFVLIDAMSDKNNPSGAIERSEARGQQLLVKSDVLPHEFNFGTREQFEKMGVIFGKKADDLFSYVTLPPGWKKVSTDHSMWSKLVDEQGRERAGIFYKAAFYDRRAFLNIERRFSYSYRPVKGYDNPEYIKYGWIGVVIDCNKIIWQTAEIEPEPKYSNANRDLWIRWNDRRDNLTEEARQWLKKNYPDYENPLAYW